MIIHGTKCKNGQKTAQTKAISNHAKSNSATGNTYKHSNTLKESQTKTIKINNLQYMHE